MQASNIQGYVMNLDPAVMSLPFSANIDTRDTIKYKEVMEQFNLGPNGGILTSLNLFSTKFYEVISVIEKRADQLDYVLVDTPGQIEIFTSSASGAIITEAFASTFPTIITYVVDTPCSSNPQTFMSNMLYACSILYKTRLPLVLAFNKTDMAQHQFALEVISVIEKRADQLDYVLVDTPGQIEIFTCHIFSRTDRIMEQAIGNGMGMLFSRAGMEAFFKAIEASAEEYMETYKFSTYSTLHQVDKRSTIILVWHLLVFLGLILTSGGQRSNIWRKKKEGEHGEAEERYGTSRGETVVLSIGLKDREISSKAMMDEDDEEEEEYNYERFTEEEGVIDEDEDEDEEVPRFSFELHIFLGYFLEAKLCIAPSEVTKSVCKGC
ncbi:hypothetical protein TEA_004961 [Camellia sinensis var. sinensis]|uniref:GPN-loop GTPase n=1 Tax=Camellia sinensis var. sinensis TaxID=542762 RepID=A0A4S4ELS1_CAMSN|nr:hypothetical protein TEA_004961 [Camellia sinensis var. sinensis]